MPAIQLSVAERKAHRAEAHHLDPVVMIGNDGLTAAVKKETDAALNAHGLIKVRVLGDDAGARSHLPAAGRRAGAAPIQHIGKLLVLWRPKPKKEKAEDEERKPGPREFKVIKNSSRGGQRPEVKRVRVLGNQRLTSGGNVRKAKPKQKSVKKSRSDWAQPPGPPARTATAPRTARAGGVPQPQVLPRHDPRRDRELLQQRGQHPEQHIGHRPARPSQAGRAVGAARAHQHDTAGQAEPGLRLEQLGGQAAGDGRRGRVGEQQRHGQEADRRQAAPPEGRRQEREPLLPVTFRCS